MQITQICLENLRNPHNLQALLIELKKNWRIKHSKYNSRVLYKNLRHLHNLRDVLSANLWTKKESVHQQLKNMNPLHKQQKRSQYR